ISTLSDMHLSVITISQSIPVASKAAVTISVDITDMTGSADAVLLELREQADVLSVHLDAIE
ncbi:MAG: hypothetical protein Q4D46_07735, partial [Erysipelotrichaceae bacterium]|nr:hypothetical protein [Erysipelotrichaceae bacterium]